MNVLFSLVRAIPLAFLLLCERVGDGRAQVGLAADDSWQGRQVTARFESRPVCNGAYSQLPGQPSLFVGRIRQTQDPTDCRTGAWTLALFRMNWATLDLNFEKFLLSVPAATSDEISITNGYDPYPVAFNGEIWVAFECVGRHITGTSACVAPLKRDLSGLDTARLTVPVMERPARPDAPTTFTASVPKLLAFGSRLFLYWTPVQRQKSDPSKWVNLGARGLELEVEHGGARRLWAWGSEGRAVGAADPRLTVDVLARRTADPTADQVADISAVESVGCWIYVVASVGGVGCLYPNDAAPGCYRLQVTRSTASLGPNVFGQEFLVAPSLPRGAQIYARLVEDPGGRRFLLTRSIAPWQQRAPTASTPSPGLYLYPIDLATFRFAQRPPDWPR